MGLFINMTLILVVMYRIKAFWHQQIFYIGTKYVYNLSSSLFLIFFPYFLLYLFFKIFFVVDMNPVFVNDTPCFMKKKKQARSDTKIPQWDY